MKNKLLSYVFSFTLILSLFISGIDFCCFNRSFYDWQHSYLKLYDTNLPEYIGTSEEGLSSLTNFLLEYLEDKNDSLDLQMEIHGTKREVFNEKEKTHMVDVKNLYQGVITLRNISAIVCLASFIIVYLSAKKEAFKCFYNAYVKTLIFYGTIILAVGFAAIVDFDAFWTSFHHVFFPTNDLWILSLRTDILIMIVPPDFFNNLIYFIIITIVILLALAFMVLKLLNRKALNND